MHIESTSTTIVTHHLEQTRQFYEEHFDARPAFGCGWYVVLRLNASLPKLELCLMEPREGMQPFGGGVVLNLEVSDADTLYARLSEAGLNPSIPLEDHPWGDRGFGILDPSGVMAYCYHPIAPDPEFEPYLLMHDCQFLRSRLKILNIGPY